MVGSLAFGFYMEFTGALEGLWTFRFMEPVSLFIVFSWPLRIWAVNAFCLLFNVDFSEKHVRRNLSSLQYAGGITKKEIEKIEKN